LPEIKACDSSPRNEISSRILSAAFFYAFLGDGGQFKHGDQGNDGSKNIAIT
jgi:hypothetical protein